MIYNNDRKQIKKLIFSSFFILLFSGCSIQRAQTAENAKTAMIGLSKQQVLQCMGAANNIQIEGNIESWQYLSGGNYNGTMNTFNNDGYTTGFMDLSHKSCQINIIFSSGLVEKVIYSGSTGGLLTQGEQCAYAVSNCVKN